MPGNTIGQLFRVTTFGESHGEAIGAVIDGCPPGLKLSEGDIQPDLDRRRPGQSAITTPRRESDTIRILSGVMNGITTGTPIIVIAFNHDAKSKDYTALKDLYRPSHADYTYELKYGIRDWRGSGRASARETLARVAAGAIAKKYLLEKCKTRFVSYVEQVGRIKTGMQLNKVTLNAIERSPVRCPDKAVSGKMIELIEQVKREGDSIGGVIRAVITNPPPGIGEPVFDKLPADLGKAMLSINAVKGFEYGSGFGGVSLRGSEHNDGLKVKNGKISFSKNDAGGALGGISTGQDIYFRVAFKPVATIAKRQNTVSTAGKQIAFSAQGRHDPCVLPRAVPIVDAMAAIVIMDHYLRQQSTGKSK